MKAPFMMSASARLLSSAFAALLLGGGASLLLHGEGSAIPVMCASILSGVVLTVFAVGLGLKDFPWETGLAVILLPFAMFAYVITLGVMNLRYPSGGYALMILGLMPLALALRPARHDARLVTSGSHAVGHS